MWCPSSVSVSSPYLECHLYLQPHERKSPRLTMSIKLKAQKPPRSYFSVDQLFASHSIWPDLTAGWVLTFCLAWCDHNVVSSKSYCADFEKNPISTHNTLCWGCVIATSSLLLRPPTPPKFLKIKGLSSEMNTMISFCRQALPHSCLFRNRLPLKHWGIHYGQWWQTCTWDLPGLYAEGQYLASETCLLTNHCFEIDLFHHNFFHQ